MECYLTLGRGDGPDKSPCVQEFSPKCDENEDNTQTKVEGVWTINDERIWRRIERERKDECKEDDESVTMTDRKSSRNRQKNERLL